MTAPVKKSTRAKNPKERIPRRLRQLSFLARSKDSMGGFKKGTHAKSARPLDSGKPLHVCMRSSIARGARTMQGRNRIEVKEIVNQASRKFRVRVVKYANVGNHLHFVLKLPGRGKVSREHYSRWIRLVTSRIARVVGESKRGSPLKDHRGRAKDENGKSIKFWDAIPFTRVVYGRRGWSVMNRYVFKNQLESQGLDRDTAEIIALDHFESSLLDRLPAWNTG